MLKRVEPLRNELQGLEDLAGENKMKATEVNKLINELEKSIGKYKEEYAVLISQAQAIKQDLASVESKVSTPCYSIKH
jgi:dynein heavy chain 1